MRTRVNIPASLVSAARAGDRSDLERLGHLLLRLAEAAARRTGARGSDLEDLRQTGATAALEALLGPSWDPSRSQAGSFAYGIAARAISKESQRLRTPLSFSRRQVSASVAIRRTRQRLATTGAATLAEVASHAGVSEADVAVALEPALPLHASAARQALVTPCHLDGDHEPCSDVRTEAELRLNHLTPRQRRVMDLRYGVTGPEHSLREIGEELGIPKARVWRTIRSATTRLKALREPRSSVPRHPNGSMAG